MKNLKYIAELSNSSAQTKLIPQGGKFHSSRQATKLSFMPLRYIIFFVLTYGIFLFAELPANFTYQQIKHNLPMLQLKGVSGTLWNGNAESVHYKRQIIGSVKWKISLWRIWFGQIPIELKWIIANHKGEAKLTAYLSNKIIVHSINTLLPLSFLSNFTKTYGIKLNGKAMVDLVDINYHPMALHSAKGVIEIDKLNITVQSKVNLGHVLLKIATNDEKIITRFALKDGDIKANGKITLTTDGQYKLTGQADLLNNHHALRPVLKMVGQHTGNNHFQLKKQGKVK